MYKRHRLGLRDQASKYISIITTDYDKYLNIFFGSDQTVAHINVDESRQVDILTSPTREALSSFAIANNRGIFHILDSR